MDRPDVRTEAPPSSGTTLVVEDDPVAGWFGAIVRRPDTEVGEVEIPPPLGPGPSNFARIAMAADTVGAMTAYLAGAPSIATANLELHLMADEVVGAIIARGHPIRVGRRQILVGLTISDASGQIVGRGVADNAVLSRHLEMYYSKFGIGEERYLGPLRAVPPSALVDVFGDAAGNLVVDDRSKNPLDAAHGGILAAFVEPAARRAGLATIDDCIIRYLRPARRGPVRAAARDVRPRGSSVFAAVELSDADDAVVVTAAVTGRPDPRDAAAGASIL